MLKTCSTPAFLIVCAAHSFSLLWAPSTIFVQVQSALRKVGRQTSPVQKAYELSCGSCQLRDHRSLLLKNKQKVTATSVTVLLNAAFLFLCNLVQRQQLLFTWVGCSVSSAGVLISLCSLSSNEYYHQPVQEDEVRTAAL